MPIIISAPMSAPNSEDFAPSSPSEGSDRDSDVEMAAGDAPPLKRPRLSPRGLVTPGELITSDPQWMRGHGTYNTPSSALGITASVAGTVLKTNKLLSVRPLRARYTPEIGDLVVGRIVEVQTKRWKVDTGSPLFSRLDLSAINLPGGILRRRTTADELQMRSYFSEGDVLVAEVQAVHQDGSASLHTRSLRYGKLRNGLFLVISGAGGDGRGGVVRSRRQVWTVGTSNGGGEVEVYLGVNGYIFIAKKSEVLSKADHEAEDTTVSNLEESSTGAVYSSENEDITIQTRIEIARLAGCIRALVQAGARVDEEMIMRTYDAAVEAELTSMDDDTGEGTDYLGGERGRRIVAAALATARA